MDPLHPLLHAVFQMERVIIVMGRNIHILIDRRKLDIRHTDLLPLVYKRRSLLKQIADRKH